MNPIPAIILAPLIAHPIWALLMVLAPLPIHTTGIDATYHVTPGPFSAMLVMFVASAMAWMSHREPWHGNGRGFILIVPQQFLMLLSLWTIAASILNREQGRWIARYANGYAPPEGWCFIAADQVFFAVCCILHSLKVWQTYISKKNLPCSLSSNCPEYK